MHESKKWKVIFAPKKTKQFRRWCFCSYNKPFDLFSFLLMLKKSIFGNVENMASTYAKICWIIAYFSTLFLISKKKTFSGHKINTYWFSYPFPFQFSLNFSTYPKYGRKHLSCLISKNAIKLRKWNIYFNISRTLWF